MVVPRYTDNTVQDEPTWSNSTARGFQTSAITGLYRPRGRENSVGGKNEITDFHLRRIVGE
ncbi:hypothetical protein L211DRAFT_837076 [Terfezia boudieri ATCC MYA-4762]|uniref:Uncharacterized protein n=1 Tax=Terfezia boudieri ATCC MYA-4762 TaxID=1051890 RepID=A0A3N4M314_9PEZI|nr:hypothetical protein L211DRAFT_837076 [Terfezia boudieri ATCC MYA-4762]